MGDYYQVIADLNAQPENAEASISRVRQWMIAQEIILPETTDCVLGEPHGHAPGKKYIDVVKKASPFLFELKTNGVEFISERTVFCPGGNPIELICTACGGRFQGEQSWSSAVGEWYEARGAGLLACKMCGTKTSITEWQHDPPWAFAYAGMQFWNWPELQPEFISKISEVSGHRVRLVIGKL